jgi:hypothetical protein
MTEQKTTIIKPPRKSGKLEANKVATQELSKNTKQGLIILAYPGMGQTIYPDVYSTYKHLSVHQGFIGKSKNWEEHYVKAAINLINEDDCDVCFIDAYVSTNAIIKELEKVKQPFLIFYPGTSKESLLRSMALVYLKKPTQDNAMALADVILNHDHRIANLRQYSNAIMSSTGIVNEEVLERLVEMDNDTRLKTMMAMVKIKQMKMNNQNKPKEGTSDADKVN